MGILDDAIREHLELKRKHGVPEDEVERQEEEALGPARRDVAQQPEDAEIAADPGDDASLFDGEHGDAPEAEEPAVADDETAIAEAPAADHAPVVEEPPVPSEQPLVEAQPSAPEAAPADAPFAEPPAEAPVADPPVEAPFADPLAEAPPVDTPPVEPFSEEAPEAEPPVEDHTGMEPPPAEPEPAEPEPPAVEAPSESDRHDARGDTEPHGFPALEDEALDEDEALEGDAHDDPIPGSDAEDDELDVLEDTPDFLQETPEHDRLWFEQKPPRDFDFD
jgi:hypothetical protein